MDLDSILSEYKGGTPKAKTQALDIDSILSDFKGSTSFGGTEKEAGKPTKVIINTDPKPPISGISKEASDELNQTRASKVGGENPRRSLPTTSIQESAYDADIAGKEMLSSGVEDFGSGHPYKGAGKIALGGLMRVTSPMTGIIEGAVSKPIADITGSKDIGDRAGLIAGIAVPADKGVSKVVKALPKNKALSTLVENIGQENLPAVVAAMKANPRLAPADLSPRVLQDTQHLFASDGPQIDYLAKTSGNRMASSKNAVIDAYDTTAGVSPDLAGKVQSLSDAAKKVGEEAIQPSIKGAGPVTISGTLDHLDKALQPGAKVIGDSTVLTEVKKDLNNIRKDLRMSKNMNADDLHWYQAALRKDAETLMRSSSGLDKARGQAMMEIRSKLVDDIDAAAGGKYKPALSSYRDEMHIADSFRDGYDGVFSSSKKMENDPSFTKKWFEGLTEHEQQAAREGARARIATEIGTAKNPALAGESMARSDFNKEKLKILFGEEEATNLIRILQEERAIANTHNKIVEGSQTAMRGASKEQFALPTKSDVAGAMLPTALLEGANILSSGVPGIGAAAYMGAKGVASVKDAVKMKLAREHNARYAQYALPTEGPSRDELIKALEAHIPGPKQSLLSRISSGLPTP